MVNCSGIKIAKVIRHWWVVKITEEILPLYKVSWRVKVK